MTFVAGQVEGRNVGYSARHSNGSDCEQIFDNVHMSTLCSTVCVCVCVCGWVCVCVYVGVCGRGVIKDDEMFTNLYLQTCFNSHTN